MGRLKGGSWAAGGRASGVVSDVGGANVVAVAVVVVSVAMLGVIGVGMMPGPSASTQTSSPVATAELLGSSVTNPAWVRPFRNGHLRDLFRDSIEVPIYAPELMQSLSGHN